MINEYISAAMKKARYEVLEEGSFYGQIEDLKGVWANADTLEETRGELEEVLGEWIFLRLSKNLPVPTIGGVTLSAPSVA